MLSNSYADQAVRIPPEALTTALSEIEHVVSKAVESRTDYELVMLARKFRVSAQIRGVSLASLFAEWKKNTLAFGVSAEDWVDHVTTNTGYSKQTVEKYVEVWIALKSAPETLFPLLAGKPIEGLLLLPATVREGLMDEEAWKRIADATDKNAIRDTVRELRGEATSSGTTITIRMNRDGTLEAFQNGERMAIGYLVPDRDMPDFAVAAVDRIVNGAGIRRE